MVTVERKMAESVEVLSKGLSGGPATETSRISRGAVGVPQTHELGIKDYMSHNYKREQ